MVTKIPKSKSHILIKEMGHEAILYSDEDEAIHVLNPTARRIWVLCDGQHDVEAIERDLREKFQVPEEHDVRTDVLFTLESFQKKNLLEGSEL